jgi:FtsP/CotA-like multicopper oxidase with cupredoxin domain
MDRRQFLALSTAMVGAALASRCAIGPVPAPEPQVYRSQNGLLQVHLTAELTAVPLAGRQAQLMAYNGQVPGPRLEVQPGDQVIIHLTNRLDQPTNLHYHGLHIDPTGSGDDAFRVVNPGATAEYRFDIPPDHPPGLFWYHPHYHGRVAQQLFSGLAGVFVVRGEAEAIPALQGAQEAILVLQDFDLDRQGRVQEPLPMFRMWGREGNLITLNGQEMPRLGIPQAGLLRLRLLNASPSRIYRLQLQDHPWWLMATDGGLLDTPVLQPEVLLSPGERADLLVAGNQQEGTYTLVSLPYDRGLGDMLPTSADHGHRQLGSLGQTAPIPLAQVRYQSPGTPLNLPPTLGQVEPLPPPDTVRRFVLDHGLDPDTGDQFLINGRAFNHHRIDVQAQLGTTEDWVIVNQAGMDHSFHLHTNPFQIVSRNGQTEPIAAWKDVVNIPAYEQVTIRIPFRTFTGKTVYHCHMLDHEDQGMMGIVEMVA